MDSYPVAEEANRKGPLAYRTWNTESFENMLEKDMTPMDEYIVKRGILNSMTYSDKFKTVGEIVQAVKNNTDTYPDYCVDTLKLWFDILQCPYKEIKSNLLDFSFRSSFHNHVSDGSYNYTRLKVEDQYNEGLIETRIESLMKALTFDEVAMIGKILTNRYITCLDR